MKKLLMMFAAVAGLSFFGMSGTAEASHRCYGGGGGYYGGGYYSRGYVAPVYGVGYGRVYSRGPVYSRGYYDPHFSRGYYGRRDYNYGPSFGVRTRGFGLYIR